MDKCLLDVFTTLEHQICKQLAIFTDGRYLSPADVPSPKYWQTSKLNSPRKITITLWWDGGSSQVETTTDADYLSFTSSYHVMMMFRVKYGHGSPSQPNLVGDDLTN